ncbi:MAG: alginate lyase family protein [Armatimonadetes bacterium]|nr:alginate lyase family protein [Armatimonadota bacterium]
MGGLGCLLLTAAAMAAPVDHPAVLLQRLDLARPGLEAVRAAAERNDVQAACAALAEHYRKRTEPAVPGDLRGRRSVGAKRLEEANAALESRFVGQPNYGLQPVPTPLDWAYNPGKDPEWTWQFNRHSAWEALAAAYAATADERYARCFVELLRDWVAKNPPGTRYSWRTIEAGIRPVVWLPAFFAFLASPAFTPADQALMLDSFADHADYLAPQGHFSSGSNWGMIESMGLLHIGAFLPELRDARAWRGTAWSRIEGEMFRQVLPDGAQTELTTSYHFGVLNDFREAADIARQGGITPKPEYDARLQRMYDYGLCLVKPDGTVPMLGDSWPGNIRGTLASGGRAYQRPDLLYVGTAGKEGAPPAVLDTHLPDAGYYVFRTSWTDPQGIWLLTDIAHRWGGGHQHPDALHLELYAYGKTLTPDTGSYLYYGPGRAAASRTSAHTTVTVDEADQNHAPAVALALGETPTLSFVDGEQPGYPEIVHRRQVAFARPAGLAPLYVLVIDRLTGPGHHTLDQAFHFLPGTMAVDVEALSARTTNQPGPNLLVQALRREGVSLEPLDSFVSFTYTVKEPRPAVRFRQTAELPARFVTLLVPYPGETAPELTATLVTDRDTLVEVTVSGPGYRDRLLVAGGQGVELRAGGGRAVSGQTLRDPLLGKEGVKEGKPRCRYATAPDRPRTTRGTGRGTCSWRSQRGPGRPRRPRSPDRNGSCRGGPPRGR